MNVNNSPVGGFIGPSTEERGKYELITAEDTGRSMRVEAMNATTILSMLPIGKIKKNNEINWRERRMKILSLKEIKKSTEGTSTKVGLYVFTNALIDLPLGVEEELYDENFFARQRKLLKEKDKFMSIDEI
jgi:hypothetical protein